MVFNTFNPEPETHIDPHGIDLTTSFDFKSLQKRVTGKNSLPQLLHELALWLGTIIRLEMIAYWNLNQSHLEYNDQHPDLPILLEVTHAIIDGPLPRIRHWRQKEWLLHLWIDTPLDKGERMLIIEKGYHLPLEQMNPLLREMLKIFQSALKQCQNPTDAK
ncbi:MAG: hypothetical protein H7832_10985 [Magnetococcus sp. DMHC-6]